MQYNHRTMFWLVGALLSTLVETGCGEAKPGHQTGTANSFVGKTVTFEMPKGWGLQKHVNDTNLETFQYLIPDAATENISDSANALIMIEPAPAGTKLADYANAHLQSESNLVLTNIFDSDKWCTALSSGQQDQTHYIIMDRYGMDQGVMLILRVAHPVLDTNATAVELSISNFNQTVRSLKIGGSNAVTSEVRKDHGSIWLRSFSDMNTNWMVDPTSHLVGRSSIPGK